MINKSDLDRKINEYTEKMSSAEDQVLSELHRFTYLKVIHPRMLCGPVQGKLLEFISHMINPERILEIGTYTGYSAICLARGLRKNGKLTTIEINEELNETALTYIRKAGLDDRIECLTGDALVILPALKEKFDLIFMDGEKSEYIEYYKLALKLMKAGGYIIADNTLWDGKVIENEENYDHVTSAIHAFNLFVRDDPSVDKVILPMRDGLTILRKLN